jgi:hypothetical protein
MIRRSLFVLLVGAMVLLGMIIAPLSIHRKRQS